LASFTLNTAVEVPESAVLSLYTTLSKVN